MLQMRARAWAIRDLFADVMCGLGIVEEVADYERQRGDTAKSNEENPTAGRAAVESTSPASHTAITEIQLQRIAELRPNWLRSVGVNPDDGEAVKTLWITRLQADYGVETARSMTHEQAEKLIDELGKLPSGAAVS